MHTRKVQEVGGGTVTVSLPRDWAAEHGVGAGDQLYLYPHLDGSLVVRRSEKGDSELASVHIDADGHTGERLIRLLRAGYAVGYRRLTLESPAGFDDDQHRAITTTVRALTGVAITEESPTRITAEGMLNTADVSIRQSVVNLRYSTLSMYDGATAGLEGAGPDVSQLGDRRDSVARTAAHVTRHFNRALREFDEIDALGLDRPALFRYHRTAAQLDEAAGKTVTLARATADIDTDGHDLTALAELARETRSVLDSALDAVVNGGSREAALTALEEWARVDDRAEEIERRIRGADGEARLEQYESLRAIQGIARCGSRIGKTALRSNLGDE